MITIDHETKIAVNAALNTYESDPRLCVRIRKKGDLPIVIAATISHWPADSDGFYRIPLSDSDLVIVWRTFAFAEMAAGRGKLDDADAYAKAFGIMIVPAYEYVTRRFKGTGINPTDGARTCWTNAIRWLMNGGGDFDEPSRRDKRYGAAKRIWARRAEVHRVCREAGLALPGRNTWHPAPTILAMTPDLEIKEVLARVDQEALASLEI